MAVIGLITQEGLNKSIEAATNYANEVEGWFIQPYSFKLAETAGVLISEDVNAASNRDISTLEETWFEAPISGRIVKSPNTIEFRLSVPPGSSPVQKRVQEIYIIAKDSEGVDFLLAIGQPESTDLYIYNPGSELKFRLDVTLANIAIGNIYQFTYTQATEIADHDSNPNAHPDIIAALIRAGFPAQMVDQEYVGQFTDEKATFVTGVSDYDVVYKATSGNYAKALASDTIEKNALGIADVTNGRVFTGGFIQTTVTGMTAFDVVYLSDITPGLIATSYTNHRVPLGIFLNNTGLIYFIPGIGLLAYLGFGGTSEMAEFVLDPPSLSGSETEEEELVLSVTITNYDPDIIYEISVTGGSATRTGDTISWTLPEVDEDTSHRISVYALKTGYLKSLAGIHNVNVIDTPITTPVILNPTEAQSNIGINLTISTSAFEADNESWTHTATRYQVDTLAGDFSSPVYDSGYITDLTSHTLVNELEVDTFYKIRVQFMANSGSYSNWSILRNIKTRDSFYYVEQPTNISPGANTTNQALTPTLTLSDYAVSTGSDAHTLSRFRIYESAVLVYDSGDIAATTTHEVPSGTLDLLTQYSWQGKYIGTAYDDSEWSGLTSFTTTNVGIVQPNITAPVAGNYYNTQLTITTSAFAVSEGSDTLADLEVEVDLSTGDFSSPVYSNMCGATLTHTLALGLIENNTSYIIRARHHGNTGAISAWSDLVTITKLAAVLTTPTMTYVKPYPVSSDKVTESFQVNFSAFAVTLGSDTHESTEFQLVASSGNYTSPLHSVTLENVTTYTIPYGVVSVGTQYKMRVRYKGVSGIYSSWSSDLLVTTFSQWNFNWSTWDYTEVPSTDTWTIDVPDTYFAAEYGILPYALHERGVQTYGSPIRWVTGVASWTIVISIGEAGNPAGLGCGLYVVDLPNTHSILMFLKPPNSTAFFQKDSDQDTLVTSLTSTHLYMMSSGGNIYYGYGPKVTNFNSLTGKGVWYGAGGIINWAESLTNWFSVYEATGIKIVYSKRALLSV